MNILVKAIVALLVIFTTTCVDQPELGSVDLVVPLLMEPDAPGTATSCEVVPLMDYKFRGYILEQYDFDHDGVIRGSEVADVTRLTIPRTGWSKNSDGVEIDSLEGIECFHSLETFIFKGGVTEGLHRLASMDKLTELSIWSDWVKDLRFLEDLPLERLSLRSWGIKHLESIGKLGDITMFVLTYSQVRHLTPLAGLTKLNRVFLHENKIQEIGPLGGLSNLEVVGVVGNQITDLTPLIGLTKLKQVFVSANPIDCETQLENLELLKRGVAKTDIEVGDICP